MRTIPRDGRTFSVSQKERVHAEVVRSAGLGEGDVSLQLPFTPGAKEALELALREALLLGHDYIGAEHILLGLVRESEGTASAVLSEFDVDPREVRNEILNRLSEASAGPPRERSEPGRLTAQEEVELAKRLSAAMQRRRRRWSRAISTWSSRSPTSFSDKDYRSKS